jgi:hypothetical protein
MVGVERKLGGDITIFDANNLAQCFTIGASTPSKVAVVNGLELFGEDITLLSLNLEQELTTMRLKNDALFANFKNLNKVIFNFYSNSDEVITVDFIWKTSKNMSYKQSIKVYYFTKGKNVIEFTNLSTKDWDKYESVTFIEFKIGENSSGVIPQIYLKNAVAYAESGV